MSRITRVEAIPCSVPFRRPFVIGRGAVGAAGQWGRHVFVRLETECGRVGWGEARALPAWSYETQESITTAIRGYLGPLLIGRSPWELNAIHREMYETLTPAVSNGQPFAKAALDIALHDLQGQLSGQPLHALLGGKLRPTLPLTYALGIAAPEEMAAEARSYAEAGCFKIKVAGEPERDRERVRAISEARPDADLWLDANQAYSPALLPPFLEGIRGVPRIFCLEQPVRSVDWLGLRAARERSHLPIAIDEGCFSRFDVARVAELRAAELLVLKVCKSGGLRECLQAAAVADAHGIGLLGSGLTECGIGFTASVHLFSTLQTLLPPELNGGQFLESLWVRGLRLEGSVVTVPDGPGLGIEVDEEEIRRHAVDF
ncbi:MAG: mandelate racemase/muconate lactonizing enzyme family protein [Armatimonadota bacterium]